jgi:hypothetical protein
MHVRNFREPGENKAEIPERIFQLLSTTGKTQFGV